MHGIGAGPGGYVDELVDAQVGLCRRVAAQGVRRVGGPHVQCVAIGVGVDSDAAEAGVTAGSHDTYRDLPAIGDQNLAHAPSVTVKLISVGDTTARCRRSRLAELPKLVNFGYYDCGMSTTRLMILGLVKWMQPVHGYDVRRELESWRVDEWTNIAPGSIYHGLRRLAEEG